MQSEINEFSKSEIKQAKRLKSYVKGDSLVELELWAVFRAINTYVSAVAPHRYLNPDNPYIADRVSTLLKEAYEQLDFSVKSLTEYEQTVKKAFEGGKKDLVKFLNYFDEGSSIEDYFDGYKISNKKLLKAYNSGWKETKNLRYMTNSRDLFKFVVPRYHRMINHNAGELALVGLCLQLIDGVRRGAIVDNSWRQKCPNGVVMLSEKEIDQIKKAAKQSLSAFKKLNVKNKKDISRLSKTLEAYDKYNLKAPENAGRAQKFDDYLDALETKEHATDEFAVRLGYALQISNIADDLKMRIISFNGTLYNPLGNNLIKLTDKFHGIKETEKSELVKQNKVFVTDAELNILKFLYDKAQVGSEHVRQLDDIITNRLKSGEQDDVQALFGL